MLKEFMIFTVLMLALYGLSCLISSAVLWLSAGKNQEGDLLVVPVAAQPLIRAKIGSSVERLRNSGMSHVAAVVVVDCGLPKNKVHTIDKYCRKKGIAFLKTEELAKYLENSSFQKEENTV